MGPNPRAATRAAKVTELAALGRLLDIALALPPGERAAWLTALPAVDPALKERLASMLAEADAADERIAGGRLVWQGLRRPRGR